MLQQYVCRVCRFQSISENEIFEHAVQNHAAPDGDTSPSASGSDSQSDHEINDADDDDEKKKVPVKQFFFKQSKDTCKCLPLRFRQTIKIATH